jgi:hypothetical protein
MHPSHPRKIKGVVEKTVVDGVDGADEVGKAVEEEVVLAGGRIPGRCYRMSVFSSYVY